MKVYMNLHDISAFYSVSSGFNDFREVEGSAIRAEQKTDCLASDSMSGSENIKERLEMALQKLDPELRAILESKYSFSSTQSVDDNKVADDLGITVESVAALEALALRSLFTPAKKA